jgi:hypothetical protein
MENEKIIIYIQGGNIVHITGTKNVQYKIIDWDINPEMDETNCDYYEPDTIVNKEDIDFYKNQ